MIRVGIVGSRRRATHTDHEIVRGIVRAAVERYGNEEVVVVSGGCPIGADTFARICAEAYDVWCVEFKPKVRPNAPRWEFTVAAFARNRTIAENCDVLFALVANDRKGGTENTIKHAHELKKIVYVIDETGQAYLEKDGEVANKA